MKKMFLCLCLIYGIASYAQLKKTIETNGITETLISPCGSHIVCGSSKNATISFRNINGKIKWKRQLDKGDETESIAISCLKNIIVIGAQGNKIYIYDFKGKLLWKKNYNKSEYQVAISGNGENIFVAGSVNSGSKNDFVDCYNLKGDLLWRHKINIDKWHIWDISTNYDGDLVLFKTNSEVYILNHKHNSLKVFDIVEGNKLLSAKLFNDGSMFYASYLNNDKNHSTIALYDIEKGLVWDKSISNKYLRIAIDKKNNLYTYGLHNNIDIYDTKGELLGRYITQGGLGISTSYDGKYIVTNSYKNIKVFDNSKPPSKNIIQDIQVYQTPEENITYHNIPKSYTIGIRTPNAILNSTPLIKSKIKDSIEYKQLLKEKNTLLKKLSYVKVNHYLNEVEYSRKNISPLQKLYKNKTNSAFWKSNNTLHDAHLNWRKHVENFLTFKETHSPLFKKLNDEKKAGLIDRKLFYSKNKVIDEELKTAYPVKFRSLKMNFINALREMWLAAGELWLSQQKKNDTEALTDWLPKSSLSTLKKSTIFINLNEKITTIDNKLDAFK